MIHNFSSYNLSQTETFLLLKGLDFSLPPKKLKFENHSLSFELLYRNVLQDDDNNDKPLHLKSKIKGIGLLCNKKMDELLSDSSTFMKVEFNSKYKANHEIRLLLDMEKEIKSCLDDLQNSNYLSEDNYKFMKPYGSKPVVIYGLCKVHKDITPNDRVPTFRPILSAIGTCSYNLGKLFVPLLKQCIINETLLRTLLFL